MYIQYSPRLNFARFGIVLVEVCDLLPTIPTISSSPSSCIINVLHESKGNNTFSDNPPRMMVLLLLHVLVCLY